VSAHWVLLLDPGTSTLAGAALSERGDGVELAAGIVVPAGSDELSLIETLRLVSRERGTKLEDAPRLVLRGGAENLPRAVIRLAAALGMHVRLLDIGATAARLIDAAPDGRVDTLDLPAGALSPRESTERRRRCDAALSLLPEISRAEISDRLGDISDGGGRGRDALGDQIRIAALNDAVRRVGEELRGRPRPAGGILLVGGSIAAAVRRKLIPLTALAPVAGVGLTHIHLEPLGVISAIGDPALADADAGAVARSAGFPLLEFAGDLLCIEEGSDELVVDVNAESEASDDGTALAISPAPGSRTQVHVARGEYTLTADLAGGSAGAAVAVGWPALTRLPALHESAADRSSAVVDAPHRLLQKAAKDQQRMTARALLGDSVRGQVVVSPGDPDSRGWEAARSAGILAVESASPETVLRARAVGVRGVIVRSLSDAEREALDASLARRVAAAVATDPFGLLILEGRHSQRAQGRIAELDGCDVTLCAEPPELQIHDGGDRRWAASRSSGGDTIVTGGEYEGETGEWEGISVTAPDDPRGIVVIDGSPRAIPLADLQRRSA